MKILPDLAKFCPISDEPTASACVAHGLAVLVDQRAVGFVVEDHLGDAPDNQRINAGHDDPQHDRGDDAGFDAGEKFPGNRTRGCCCSDSCCSGFRSRLGGRNAYCCSVLFMVDASEELLGWVSDRDESKGHGERAFRGARVSSVSLSEPRNRIRQGGPYRDSLKSAAAPGA